MKFEFHVVTLALDSIVTRRTENRTRSKKENYSEDIQNYVEGILIFTCRMSSEQKELANKSWIRTIRYCHYYYYGVTGITRGFWITPANWKNPRGWGWQRRYTWCSYCITSGIKSDKQLGRTMRSTKRFLALPVYGFVCRKIERNPIKFLAVEQVVFFFSLFSFLTNISPTDV